MGYYSLSPLTEISSCDLQKEGEHKINDEVCIIRGGRRISR
jgi:hypothetical protein